MSKKPYYISTAIAYTSGKPHIGNTYEIVLADSIARYKRLTGYDVYFQTGTDEHGQKIETKANEAGITPQKFVDNVSEEIHRIWDIMNTSYDKFVRTTDPYHEKKVQQIFKKLYEQGDIYKDEYEGMYCEPCESFFTESQLIDGKCPDCGREVSYEKEEAYFFKLSKYANRLMEYIETHPEFIQPESRKNEMVNNFLKPGLKDLCVSRTSFKWGIPVDFDPGHVVYVWIDALSNYITFLGYDPDGNHEENYNKYWPADVHLIGKDILRFHTLYWPIMLMALDLPLPKQIFGHPWLLLGEGKMSKSKGNVIYADDLVDLFGVDSVRYYLLREMPFAQDGTLTYEQLIDRINGELVNILGNLVNRTIAMSKKYFDSIVSNPKDIEDIDNELIELTEKTPLLVEEKMNELKVADAINLIIALARRSNKYIDETMPWVLAKEEDKQDRLRTVLYNLLESIRVIGVLITPFLPETGENIIKMLNTKNSSYESILKFGGLEEGITLNKAFVLFNRLDAKEVLAKIDKEDKKEEKTQKKKDKKTKKEVEEISEISIDDFAKVDLRIGKILSAKKHPDADKLLVFEVMVGSAKRQIVSGIAKYFTPEELVGKNVVVVANLKPAKLRGEISQGMILLAEDNDGKLTFITPEEDIESGLKVR